LQGGEAEDGFLEGRERLLQQRGNTARKEQKGGQMKELADSGYASLLHSGCSSNRGSRSPSK
jgi:hypothetical protein